MTTPTGGEVVRAVHQYVVASQQVVRRASAGVEALNEALGFRDKAAMRPQHEVSIDAFLGYAHNAERELRSLNGQLNSDCAIARDAASQLRAIAGSNAEAVLRAHCEPHLVAVVRRATAIIHAEYRSDPAGFRRGVEETNSIWESLGSEVIYVPRRPLDGEERRCPWCAETIKAEAVICRFCGRDAQTTPNSLEWPGASRS